MTNKCRSRAKKVPKVQRFHFVGTAESDRVRRVIPPPLRNFAATELKTDLWIPLPVEAVLEITFVCKLLFCLQTKCIFFIGVVLKRDYKKACPHLCISNFKFPYITPGHLFLILSSCLLFNQNWEQGWCTFHTNIYCAASDCTQWEPQKEFDFYRTVLSVSTRYLFLKLCKIISALHRSAFCQFLFRWIYYNVSKIHKFWEGHTILWNLYCSNGQIYCGDFTKFCGLLRIYEL